MSMWGSSFSDLAKKAQEASEMAAKKAQEASTSMNAMNMKVRMNTNIKLLVRPYVRAGSMQTCFDKLGFGFDGKEWLFVDDGRLKF